MAEILHDQALRPRRRYPWDEWTDGQTRRVVQGPEADFTTSAAHLRVQLYAEATRRGMRVSTRLEGPVGAETAIVFQFRPKEGHQ